ncbi:hypothetical protein LOCC1_G002549 [Lachnellula occidentalis]|uniref:Uncharacterized protein n=1 Tax=Lachnellula occidentalis TaxID=215460 RepID=A0A8H8S3I3_9HELO|nr:hypothetical protein LOCC1_G002549 [Lachnellula occidentalis]
MALAVRLPSIKFDRSFTSSRGSTIRCVFVVIAFCVFGYLLLLPLFSILKGFQLFFSFHTEIVIPGPGEDALKHFAGSRDCGISQSDIYLAPFPLYPGVSPFCKNRATLLEALSSGGRHGFDEPFVGKGCTYRWFSTPEICMILERFNALVFIGDSTAQTIYAALNILLREDLALGGLQQWMMNDQDREACKCNEQFVNRDCLGYSIKGIEKAKKNMKESPYFCERVPHAYVPIDSTPASSTAQNAFKELTYDHPSPWQPSPVILSFSPSLDITTTTRVLNEWASLATGAERSIPLLFLGPQAAGFNKAGKDGNAALWKFQDEIAEPAKRRDFDLLGLWNMTAQASSRDGEKYGENVALVQAMMVINWLSKLGTS